MTGKRTARNDMVNIDGAKLHDALFRKKVNCCGTSVALGKADTYLKNCMRCDRISVDFFTRLCALYGLKANAFVKSNDVTPLEQYAEDTEQVTVEDTAPDLIEDMDTKLRELEQENAELRRLIGMCENMNDRNTEILKNAKNIIAAFNQIMDIMKEVATYNA